MDEIYRCRYTSSVPCESLLLDIFQMCSVRQVHLEPVQRQTGAYDIHLAVTVSTPNSRKPHVLSIGRDFSSLFRHDLGRAAIIVHHRVMAHYAIERVIWVLLVQGVEAFIEPFWDWGLYKKTHRNKR